MTSRPISMDWRRLLAAVVGALLVADALYLMAHRAFNFGVTLPLAIGAALLLLAVKWHAVHRRLSTSQALRRLWRAGWMAAFAWLCSVAVFFGVLARANPGSVGQDPRALLVLGSGAPGGKASPVLAARLDLALAQAAKYPAIPVVVSGGVGFGETLSEGRVMGDYLRARGLDAARMAQEEKSDSTHDNLRFSLPLLLQRGVSAQDPIQLVTSDFHTLRAQRIAWRAGYTQVTAVGAPTPLYVRYNAWLREYFAFISGFVLREY